MRNPRSLPGFAQLVLAIVTMAALWQVALALGVPNVWAGLAGVFFGSLLLGLWEAFTARD